MDDVPVDNERSIKKTVFNKKYIYIILIFVFAVIVLLIISKNKSKRSLTYINTADSECDDDSTDSSSVDELPDDYDIYSEIKEFIARQTDYVMNN